MKRKVAELEGALLDAAVAKARGDVLRDDGLLHLNDGSGRAMRPQDCSPSGLWEFGGQIIERERIAVYFDAEYRVDWERSPSWIAGFELSIDEGFCGSELTGPDAPLLDLKHSSIGSTPLIAAMRAYVTSVLGEEVELP